MMEDTPELELRYHDKIRSARLETLFSSGPAFYNVATPFRTPRNADLTLWLEGNDGVVWRSTDGGNWWFSTIYNPRKIDTFKQTGFRLNRMDPWVYRGAVHPVARMIYPGRTAVDWPSDLETVSESPNLFSWSVLSPRQAYDAGFIMGLYKHHDFEPNDPERDTDYPGFSAPVNSWPHGNFSFPNTPGWLQPVTNPGPSPDAPPADAPPAEVEAYIVQLAQWTLQKAEFDAYVIWKNSTPLFGILKNGKVTRVLSVMSVIIPVSDTESITRYTHVGLAPFYNREVFVGWGAVKTVGTSLPYGTGIMESLSKWSSELASFWQPIAHEDFDPTKDPQL